MFNFQTLEESLKKNISMKLKASWEKKDCEAGYLAVWPLWTMGSTSSIFYLTPLDGSKMLGGSTVIIEQAVHLYDYNYYCGAQEISNQVLSLFSSYGSELNLRKKIQLF